MHYKQEKKIFVLIHPVTGMRVRDCIIGGFDIFNKVHIMGKKVNIQSPKKLVSAIYCSFDEMTID